MESIQILIREYMERHTEDVNVSLDDAVNIPTATSKICLKIKPKKSRKRVKATSTTKWFDRECRLKDTSYEECQIKNIAIPLILSYGRNFTKPLLITKSFLTQKGKHFRLKNL